jgi:hypothetical protein
MNCTTTHGSMSVKFTKIRVYEEKITVSVKVIPERILNTVITRTVTYL